MYPKGWKQYRDMIKNNRNRSRGQTISYMLFHSKESTVVFVHER